MDPALKAMSPKTLPSHSAKAHLPLVSIIIPSYNRKALLHEAVQSCQAQTWSKWEVIIVDDGSTDGTTDLMAELLRSSWRGQNIRYVRQQNSGAPAARNTGLALATGDYVQFLDSDDLLFPDKIERQLVTLALPENAEAEGCFCYGQMGAAVSPQNQRIGVYCVTPREYLQRLSTRMVHGMQTSAPLWRRSFLTSQPGWWTEIDLGDDLEYHVRLLSQAKKICFVDKPLFFVREHDGPRLSDAFKNRQRVLSAIRTRKAVFETLGRSGHWDAEIQQGFLHAMRTIYANLLDCGTKQDIAELEAWLLDLAHAPKRRRLLPLVIRLRRLFGRQAVLLSHRLFMNLHAQG
jgi:glycosyltransferase involved in cell wall biosynthesis